MYRYRYYNCRSATRSGKEKCEGFRIPVDVLDRAVLRHLAETLFTVERCRSIMQDLVEENGRLRQRTVEQRRRLDADLDDVRLRIRRWEHAFESGDLDAADGASRLRELRAREDELKEAAAKIVQLRAPPPFLYTEANVTRFQDKLRDLFLGEDQALAKNYLRFLVENIEIDKETVTIVARSDAALRMMAGTEATTAGELTASAVSPTTVVPWLRRRGSNSRPGG